MKHGTKATIKETDVSIFVYQCEINGKTFYRNMFKPSETYFPYQLKFEQ